MEVEPGLAEAAHLFKVLGNESRLRLLRIIDAEPRAVSALAEAAEMSQPLVSQHLRALRSAGLVVAEREGKESIYRVVDHHVTHVVDDAIDHVLEPETPDEGDHDHD